MLMMAKLGTKPTSISNVESSIREIRGERVILDSDLARLYGVPTFRFNEAVKRNHQRFPPDFRFQLTEEEWTALQSLTEISWMREDFDLFPRLP
jgi:hypothetical protein